MRTPAAACCGHLYDQCVNPSGASSADIDFVTGAPADGAGEPVWIHGAPSRGQCTDPPIQVHQSDRHTFILRVSKAVSFEAPFVFLMFGNERAILFDTGGDPQFADRPHTTVVGHTAEDVRGFFGFSEWPQQVVTFDLGGRVLELTGIPGHHPASVAVYDPWTGFLLTGDTIMPGRLYAKDYAGFLDSLERLAGFARQRDITRVLGCHIEMSRTTGHDYPAGNTYQPNEVPLRLPAERIAEVRDAARAATRPGVYVHGDFIIWNGGQRLVPMLGQALRLFAYNRANRKLAKKLQGKPA